MTAYRVVYPSGRQFELRGELAVVDLPSVGPSPVVEVSDQRLFFLDPRAVVTVAATGVVVYSIDMVPSDELTQNMRRALRPAGAAE